MKQLTTILLVLFSINMCYSQGASLTKEETVNYINNKITESINKIHPYRVQNNNLIIYENRFRLGSNGKVQYSCDFASDNSGCYQNQYKRDGNVEYYKRILSEIEFSPIHIQSIEIMPTLNNVGLIKLQFISNALKQIHYSYSEKKNIRYPGNGDAYSDCYSRDYAFGKRYTDKYFHYEDSIYIPYVKIDKEDQKIIKAFNYLIDLSKAEDDPFGN
ncbi:hypothetical protein [Pseudopedobacter beijingensis]|uniref:Uncharacterized protein n=1 Tax=Pseudopedobacter beijingensis TaxID=1207056 RepID=A0ABW4IF04_9SPHI